MKRLLLALLALPAFSAYAEPQLAPNAPADRPFAVDVGQQNGLDAAIAPYVLQAKSTYSAARAKFEAGLSSGESFFITTRLHDDTGRFEQVFVLVESISGGVVHGHIASDINRVAGYRNGDRYNFPETELIDWLITHPDGSEEGNFVGKFLDSYQAGGA